MVLELFNPYRRAGVLGAQAAIVKNVNETAYMAGTVRHQGPAGNYKLWAELWMTDPLGIVTHSSPTNVQDLAVTEDLTWRDYPFNLSLFLSSDWAGLVGINARIRIDPTALAYPPLYESEVYYDKWVVQQAVPATAFEIVGTPSFS